MDRMPRTPGTPMRILSAILLCCCLLTGGPALAAGKKDEFKQAVIEVLKENPELILDILREHSELVLEIAQQGNIQRQRKAVLAQWEIDAVTPKKINLENRFFRGDAKASVTIVAFSDYVCPYCQRAEYTLKQLMEKYKGKVRFTFKPLPKEDQPLSLAAAKYSIAAYMQSAEKGWAFHDLLFENAAQLERDGEPFLKAQAVKAGLDLKRLMADAAGAKVQAVLDEDNQEADAIGAQGTPYFLVNNLVVRGAVAKELFEEAINRAMKGKSK